MRVIKDGRKEIKVKCLNCGSELAYQDEDIKSGKIGYGNTYVYVIQGSYVTCPICGNEIQVPTVTQDRYNWRF